MHTTLLNDKRSFDLSLDFEGRHYSGTVVPSAEWGNDEMPVFFRVEMDHRFFTYLCCADDGWREWENNDRPKDLVNAIGQFIRAHYREGA